MGLNMEIKVSDYIADFWAEHGIKTVFTVVGGGAMHMNDSFGHHPKLKCVYNHHEQASAIAAEAYYRVNNELAGVCVTTGPGAINALNGVVGAYQDSIPMLVASGQVKTTLMTKSTGLDLRTFGNQEFDITSALSKVAKYYTTITKIEDVRYCLEKAYYLAISGRPGPTWLDIPLDIQGSKINPEQLKGYDPIADGEVGKLDTDDKVKIDIDILIKKLMSAKRPVLYAGNGIRIAGAQKLLLKLAEIIKIPVVTCWDSIDLIETENIQYVGRAGTMGDRPGNFAIQNSDFLITIGTRLNIYQVGYNPESWAREAYVATVDVDPLELKKKSIHIDLPICADAKNFLEKFLEIVSSKKDIIVNDKWNTICQNWKHKYQVVEERFYKEQSPVNVYALMDALSRKLPEGMITVATNGSASVVGSASYFIKKDQHFIMNCALSSMGYDLPAAVGACVANNNKPIICLAGDGSIMMNLQELQTIVTNKLPVKIVVINNDGYHQIRLTQTNLFNKNFVGIGPESGDLGFPDFGKLSNAFGIEYRKCINQDSLQGDINWLLAQDSYCVLEVVCSTTQIFEPKSATKRLEDGTLYSPPLEDLAPFLSRDELKNNMFIKMLDEK